MKAVAIMLLTICCIVAGFFALSYWVSFPERSAQEKAPDGINVVWVDFPSDPNILTYDPDLISEDQLVDFGRELCRYTPLITDVEPTWLDNLRAHRRVSIVCG